MTAREADLPETGRPGAIHNCRDGYVWTAPVGRFLPNAFGLYDMLGNVWEWVTDCWNERYEKAPIDGSPWTSGECEARITRGGSYLTYPGYTRAAARIAAPTSLRDSGLGFRVARTLPLPPTGAGAEPYRRYISPVWNWSVNYPQGWTLDSHDPEFVKIQPPSTLSGGLVGIHSRGRVIAPTLGEVADAYLTAWTRDTSQRGTKSEVISRRSGTLSDGTAMIEVEHLIGTGTVGKSRKIIVVAEGRTFILDAESYLDSWAEFAPYFEQILTSFRVRR